MANNNKTKSQKTSNLDKFNNIQSNYYIIFNLLTTSINHPSETNKRQLTKVLNETNPIKNIYNDKSSVDLLNLSTEYANSLETLKINLLENENLTKSDANVLLTEWKNNFDALDKTMHKKYPKLPKYKQKKHLNKTSSYPSKSQLKKQEKYLEESLAGNQEIGAGRIAEIDLQNQIKNKPTTHIKESVAQHNLKHRIQTNASKQKSVYTTKQPLSKRIVKWFKRVFHIN